MVTNEKLSIQAHSFAKDFVSKPFDVDFTYKEGIPVSHYFFLMPWNANVMKPLNIVIFSEEDLRKYCVFIQIYNIEF